MGVFYLEVFLSDPNAYLDSEDPIAFRKEVGGLIRRLRSKRGITQEMLSSLTGINRTYLSRAERGQVLPSAFVLMQISVSLGVDKVLLRVRKSSILLAPL